MTGEALGVIETIGLVPAIEAADASLKAANVSLEGVELPGAGLVAIVLRGDVSSVKASVAAGASAGERLGRIFSTTVIARTADGLDLITQHSHARSRRGLDNEEQTSGHAVEHTESVCQQPGIEQLQQMSVVELRSLARKIESITMSRVEIRSAKKNDLIENIMKYYRKRGGTHG